MGKKKQRTEHRKEIVFDENARREFITGFRKRKKERRQIARQKIAEEVRQEKLKERQEHRDFMKQQKSVGTGVEVADDNDAVDNVDDEPESANAELTSFLLGDTLTTTVVEPLLSNAADEGAIEPQPAKRALRVQLVRNVRAAVGADTFASAPPCLCKARPRLALPCP